MRSLQLKDRAHPAVGAVFRIGIEHIKAVESTHAIGQIQGFGALDALVGVVQISLAVSQREVRRHVGVFVDQLGDTGEQVVVFLVLLVDALHADVVIQIVQTVGDRCIFLVKTPLVAQCKSVGQVVVFLTSRKLEFHTMIAELAGQSAHDAAAHVLQIGEKRQLVAGHVPRGRRSADRVAEILKTEGSFRIQGDVPAQIVRFDTNSVVLFLIDLVAGIVELGIGQIAALACAHGREQQGRKNE